MINNGSMHYDHDRDGTHTTIGGCEVKFRNFAHDTYVAIRYENDVLTGNWYFNILASCGLSISFAPKLHMIWTTRGLGLLAWEWKESNYQQITFSVPQQLQVSNKSEDVSSWLYIIPYRWFVGSTWHRVNEAVWAWWSWRRRHRRRESSYSTFVCLLWVTSWSCRWSQAIKHVWCQTVLPSPSRSHRMHCLCCDWHHDLPKTAGKLSEALLLNPWLCHFLHLETV